jgi:hypothetical protein
MPPKRSRGIRAQIDREIRDLDKERARLVAARAELKRDRPRRISQDDVADYLKEHPRSGYTEIATGLGVDPTNIAAHLKRGKKTGRFVNDAGKWSVVEGWEE